MVLISQFLGIKRYPFMTGSYIKKRPFAGSQSIGVQSSLSLVKFPCLLCPFVSLDTTREELDGLVDLFFDL